MPMRTPEEQNRDVLDLLRMVAPERAAELDGIIQQYTPSFVEASDQPRFIMRASLLYGFVQYSNHTLLQVWLFGWVMWREMYCWSTFLWLLAKKGQPFVLSEFNAMPDQADCYVSADTVHSQALDFAKSDPMDWARWPSSVPKPLDIALHSKEDWMIKDLVHHAIALFLLHELRHLMLHADGQTFSSRTEEEFECDRWAAEYLIAASDAYAKASGEDPILVKSKRAMGITLGMAVIAHIQELGLWEEGGEHPSVAGRIARLASIVDLPGNDSIWNVACSFLLASLRRQGVLPKRLEFRDQQDLLQNLLFQTDLEQSNHLMQPTGEKLLAAD
jgi:hypothetical protein